MQGFTRCSLLRGCLAAGSCLDGAPDVTVTHKPAVGISWGAVRINLLYVTKRKGWGPRLSVFNQHRDNAHSNVLWVLVSPEVGRQLDWITLTEGNSHLFPHHWKWTVIQKHVWAMLFHLRYNWVLFQQYWKQTSTRAKLTGKIIRDLSIQFSFSWGVNL